jgi:hypothetical protein
MQGSTSISIVCNVVSVADPNTTSTIAASVKAKVDICAGHGRLTVVGAAAALEGVAGLQRLVASRGGDSKAEKEADGQE